MGKFYLQIFLLFLSLVLGVSSGHCQLTKTLRVIDGATRQALSGATVYAKATEQFSSTDKLGNVQINAKHLSDTFVLSFVGYHSLAFTYNDLPQTVELVAGNVKLEDIVITGGINENHFNTLSRIDLNLRPARSAQEFLRIVPGLFIAQHAGGGKAEQIFLRGFDIDHGTDIQVSVDGLPVNMVSHGHGQGYADLHFVIPELVNQVDYGKGPYFAEHGNLNTSGYVSLQTLTVLDKNKVQVETGEFNHFRTLVMANLLPKTNTKQNAYIASEFLYFDGPFKSPQHFNRFNIFGKYNAQLNSSTHLGFTVSAFSSKWNASGQIPERAVDKGIIDRYGSIDDTEGGYTNRYNASMQFVKRFANGDLLESQLYYSRYNFRLYSNFTFFLEDSINGDQVRQSDVRDIAGINNKFSFQSRFGNAELKTTIGATLRIDNTFDTELSHTKNGNELLTRIKLGDITEANAALYLDEKIVMNRWLINLGARIDYLHFNYFDKLATDQMPAQHKTIISPKFNLQYTFSKKTQVFLKAGKGFHSNDTRVVVDKNNFQTLPAAYGTDLGIVLHPDKKLLLNASIWYLYLQQEFVYVGDAGVTEPSGRTKRYGIDFSARYQLSGRLFADANINFARAHFVDEPKGMNYIPLAPTLTSTGGVNYQNAIGWNGSLRYRYLHSRAANEDNSVRAKGYFVSDAVINYTQKKYELGLVIENLFNTKWNEAQFDTQTRLKDEPTPVSELHFTPGVPFFAKLRAAIFF